jgi:hypothetical protein
MLSPSIPWFYNKSVLRVGAKEKHFQFTHTVYNDWKPDSMLYSELAPLLNKIAPKALIRIKANLGTRTVENEETGYHCDTTYPCTTAILYLNTTNGYTIFEDGTKIEGLANLEMRSEAGIVTGLSVTDITRHGKFLFPFVLAI